MYKCRKKNVGKTEFSDHVSEIVICCKRKAYDIDAIKKSACCAVDTCTMTVDHFAYLFNCTPVDQGSDSMLALT